MGIALLALAAAAAAIVVAYVQAQRVLVAQRETSRVRSIFSRYVSPMVLDELLERHDPRVFSTKRGYATILVCRIWNFALFAEQLEHNEALRYLNEFYALAGRSIQKHRGMVDKFLGDGISGAFGFPLEDPEQEDHAVRAAVDIIRLVDGMNRAWASQGRRPLRVGIGINSGNVIAGEVGYVQRREYTVVGLPAIIAARLQERTEPMGAYILITESTMEPIRTTFVSVPAGTVPLRGMKRNAKCYVIRGLNKADEEKDTLLLPPPSAFPRTRLEDAVEGRSTWDSRVAQMPERDPEEPPIAEAPKPAPLPQPKAKQPKPPPPKRTKVDIPETRGFGAYDDSPALPDPVASEGYYEDDSGRPPLKLPP
ncbi:MAG: adenylate/guanylate cyclase domain-containing protein [Vulcanimicrobiaceae bacterium]